jgi:SulP family sulfate permease
VSAGSLVAYLPKMLLGVLLLYLAGLALLAQVLPQWARMVSRDRAFLLLVLASLLLFGLLPGIAIGILAGVVLFAISYARLDIIRAEGDGHRFRSNVSRPSAQIRTLARHADTTLVVQLQGYLFFGSAHQLMHRLKGRPGPGHAAARFVILDLARAEGADSSALFAFARLFQAAEERGCAVLLAAVPERLSAALRTIGPSRSWFLDLDHALEHAENAILAALGEAGPASGLADLEGVYGGIELRRALATYAERVEWCAGDPAVREGERADAMFLVESGRLTTWRETADGRRLRLRTIVPGTVIGEVAFYARSPRSASIVADQASSAFRISRAAVRRMERADAVLASMFHRRMATIAAERAADSVRLLTAGSG